jgi:hypothetical protein
VKAERFSPLFSFLARFVFFAQCVERERRELGRCLSLYLWHEGRERESGEERESAKERQERCLFFFEKSLLTFKKGTKQRRKKKTAF